MPPVVFPFRRAAFERLRLLLLCDAVFLLVPLFRAGREEFPLTESLSRSGSISSCFFIAMSLPTYGRDLQIFTRLRSWVSLHTTRCSVYVLWRATISQLFVC